MDEQKVVKGFKVFNPDWTCRSGFQYTCPGTFEEDVTPSVCDRGFHFCVRAADCFQYYSFNPDNKVAEVIALGDVDSDGIKSCTNKLQIVREIPWAELLEIVNTGKGCSGFCNSGNRNSGDRNVGHYNSGNRNSGNFNNGHFNNGNRNAGDLNRGNRNVGHCNIGNRNVGNQNIGKRNVGNQNIGKRNVGHCNIGDRNVGHCNIGDRNVGNQNIGNRNIGNRNIGDRNIGNCNIGDRNSGDWNKTSFSAGCFCTEEPKILLFNKPSNWTMRDWLNSDARYILNSIPASGSVLEYVYFSDMTEQEKADHPEAETTGGYLKILDKPECGQIWWHGLSDRNKSIVKGIPNFDKAIFKEITGIDVDL